MTRRILVLTVSAALVVALIPSLASACKETGCDRSFEKLDNGIRITILAKGETDVATLREKVRGCTGSHAMEGVKTSFEEIEGGIIVSRVSDNAEMVKKLHAKAAEHGEHHKCSHGEKHDEEHKCPHHHGEKHDEKHDEEHKCPHAKKAAETESENDS